GDRLLHRRLLAGLAHRLFGFRGEAFAIGGLVVNEGDVLVGEIGSKIFAGDAALLIVAAADTVDVGSGALGGEGRVGGGRRDLHHVAVGIDLRGRDRRSGAIMSGYELRAP